MLKIANFLAIASLVGFAGLAYPKDAEVGEVYEDLPQFTIFPEVERSAGPREPFDVLMGFHSKYVRKDQTAKGFLELGKGLELVAGSLTHTAHVSSQWPGPRDNLWRVTLRATELGRLEIRATVVAQVGPDRRDESASLLYITVEKTGVSGLASPLRKETVRNGQRFRYDAFLVPIDGPEEIVPAEIAELARPIHEEIGHCSGCGAGEHRVPFVVFLTPAGRIRSYRALTEGRMTPRPTISIIGAEEDPTLKPVPPDVMQAAKKALLKWKFSPSRTRNRAVAGWAIARVVVRSQE